MSKVLKKPTEKEYRAIPVDSSSSLKEFSLDRNKYYKRYVLGKRVEEKENAATNMGKLVETQLLEPELFDERFYMSATASAPTGLMLAFVEGLYDATAAATNQFGVVDAEFETLAQEAYVASGFKLPLTTVLGKFIGSDAELYYREIREVRGKNLLVVTTQDIDTADRIVEELKANFVTHDVINLQSDDRYTVINQWQIPEYEIDGMKFKSMLDKVIIDHKEKTITPYDLKCVWSVENFFNDYYLFRRAYIQAYLYKEAMYSVTRTEDKLYEGYSVKNLQFIVCDSINYYNPLIYTLSPEDMKEAYEGFTYNGKKYPGVKSIIQDLTWAKEHDVWNMSRDNFTTNGIVKIK